MAYKVDGKFTAFTTDGIILAFASCNSGLFCKGYYQERGQHDDAYIDEAIKARRELFGTIVQAVAADAKQRMIGPIGHTTAKNRHDTSEVLRTKQTDKLICKSRK